jgi:hypothetical protein
MYAASSHISRLRHAFRGTSNLHNLVKCSLSTTTTTSDTDSDLVYDEDQYDQDQIYQAKYGYSKAHAKKVVRDGRHHAEPMSYPSPDELKNHAQYNAKTPKHVQYGDKLRKILLSRKWREATHVTNDVKTERLAIIAEETNSFEAFSRVLEEGKIYIASLYKWVGRGESQPLYHLTSHFGISIFVSLYR